MYLQFPGEEQGRGGGARGRRVRREPASVIPPPVFAEARVFDRGATPPSTGEMSAPLPDQPPLEGITRALAASPPSFGGNPGTFSRPARFLHPFASKPIPSILLLSTHPNLPRPATKHFFPLAQTPPFPLCRSPPPIRPYRLFAQEAACANDLLPPRKLGGSGPYTTCATDLGAATESESLPRPAYATPSIRSQQDIVSPALRAPTPSTSRLRRCYVPDPRMKYVQEACVCRPWRALGAFLSRGLVLPLCGHAKRKFPPPVLARQLTSYSAHRDSKCRVCFKTIPRARPPPVSPLLPKGKGSGCGLG